MIGNKRDASRALSDYRNRVSDNLLSAQGCSRMVYLFDGIVYKVNNGHFNYCVNGEEYESISNPARPLPVGVFFPAVSLFDIRGDNVIAMEYIDGQRVAECYCTQDEECDADCMPNDVLDKVSGILDDTSGFNTIVNDIGIFIIDMG